MIRSTGISPRSPEMREARLTEPAKPITTVDPLPPKVGGRLLFILVGAAILVLLIVLLFDNLREFFEIILLSLFLSFAIEPGSTGSPGMGGSAASPPAPSSWWWLRR